MKPLELLLLDLFRSISNHGRKRTATVTCESIVPVQKSK